MATDAATKSHSQRLPLPTWSAGGDRPFVTSTMALVAAGAIAILLLAETSIADIARYAAFEVIFVLLPGCTLYSLLSPRTRGLLRTITIGWPLGYALEIGAFALTAALGHRWLLWLLPVMTVLILGPLLLHARGLLRATDLRRMLRNSIKNSASTAKPGSRLAIPAAGGMIMGALVVTAIEVFTRYPLPQYASSVSYYPDNVFDISVAAEARHHWPITDPYVAGHPLRYYTGFFMHTAAVNQTTGVSLDTIVLRLFPVAIIFVIGLQLWSIGRELGRSRWAGTLTLALFFPINNLSLDPTSFNAFGPTPFYLLKNSPTYALAIPLFLGLLAHVQDQLGTVKCNHATPGGTGTKRSGMLASLIIAAILVLGCTAIKSMATVDFIGGLGLFCLWRWVVARDTRLLGLLVLSVLCAGLIYYLMLTGGLSEVKLTAGVSEMGIRPFSFTQFTLFAPLFPAHSALELGLLICAVVFACALFFAPLLGALWALGQRGQTQTQPFVALLVAMFVTAASIYILFEVAGDGELAFVSYGSLAIMPVAALGLVRLWSQTAHVLRRKLPQAFLAIVAVGFCVAYSSRAVTITAWHFGWREVDDATWVWILWYVLAYGLVAVAIVYMAIKLKPYCPPAIRTRSARLLACAIPILTVLTLVKSVGIAVPEVLETAAGKRVVGDASEHRGLTGALYKGLLWVRDHTNSCDVLAVNNHSTLSSVSDSRYFYYSAFTERSVYLESWAYTPGGTYGGVTFPGRLALNDRAVVDGDPQALRELARKGVSYVLVDKLHGEGAREPAAVSSLVFNNAALDVYRLLTGPIHNNDKCP